MRILIDARYLDGTYTGIGTYSLNLIENLSRIDRENFYYILVRPEFDARLQLGQNFQLVAYPRKPVSVSTLTRLGRYVDSLKVDLMHSTFPLAPMFMKTRLAVTVHDLQPFIDPEFSARRSLPVQWGYGFFYRTVYPATLNKAKWIINVSYHTRDAVASYFPDLVPKLVVVPSGLDRSHFNAPVRSIEETTRELRLDKPYILYYGSTRPNKNLPNMIRGFATYVRDFEDNETEFVLLLKKDRFFRDIDRVIRQEKVQHRVRVLGQVSPSDQRALLGGARIYMFATKYEGFGFPALEAMAAGIPVIAGRSGALPEICGKAAEYVSPDSPQEIAIAIQVLMRDERRRNELIELGAAHSGMFDWKEAAERVRDIYRLLF
ncbi:MAG TPA: glycosyltransferase family 1 protein [Candidatus Sumerlaeota bacterium]|nr:glycosyltransferase family 1 protein [Candidatus Sumerlaeota bacterium]HMZ50793.1 glycosyltransferase family 1 protein [Candidatus Sumerlaeota bacterium]